MGRTRLQIDANRRAATIRRSLGGELRLLREDAGITKAAVASVAGVSPSMVSRIEAMDVAASLEAYAAIAAALGGDLSVRVYPNTGPTIRDRLQAPVIEELLRSRHARWRGIPEVVVRSPARGVIDLVLFDPTSNQVVSTEFHSEIRRVEQQLRWSADKTASLPSSDLWALLDHERPVGVSRLLVLRSTRAMRSLVRTYRSTFEAAYPADPRAAIASLTGTADWPGAALLWASITPEGARIIARPLPAEG